MRKFGLSVSGSVVARTASAALVASLLAGCSSDSLRLSDGFFTGTGADTMTTGSVTSPTPPAAIAGAAGATANANAGGYSGYTPSTGQPGAVAQPYPGDTGTGRYALAPAGGYSAGAVDSQPLPPAGQQAVTQPASQPATYTPPAAATPPASATASTGARPEGWSTTGAPRVTLEPNETIYSVATRYGVPVDELMKANGITDATSVAAGQQLVIPAYSRGGAQSASLAPAQSAGTASAPSAGGSYTVQSGDTLSSISRKTNVSVPALRQANNLSSDVIRVGQTLSLGGASAPTTQVASTAPVTAAPQAAEPQQTASVEPQPAAATTEVASNGGATQPAGYTAPTSGEAAVDIKKTVEVEQAAIAPESTGIDKLRWPVRGHILTGFGAQDGDVRNDGIDISVPAGSDVKAAENGVVIYAGSGLKEYGNTVLIRHDDGLVTVYGHASEIKVSRGDTVQRGQVIALSGMTGEATQPKLHFEVRENATPVNPTNFLGNS